MKKRAVVFCMLVAAVGLLVPFGAGAGTEKPSDVTWVRIHLTDFKTQAPEIGRMQLDVTGVQIREGRIDALVSKIEMEALKAAGYKLEILKTASQLKAAKLDSEYKTPAEIDTILHQYEADYPNLAKIYDIGTSIEGRTIWALKVSDNVQLDEDEPTLGFNGTHHAREVMSPESILDIMEQLLTGYGTEPTYTRWVNDFETWLVPMVNPDGAAYVWEHDNMWRKDRRNNEGSSCYGVDPNRNYPAFWGSCGGSSGDPCSDTFRGPSAGSEPCVQTMMDLSLEKKFIFTISYHSYSELVIYPYGCSGSVTPEHNLLADIGAKVAARCETDSGGGTYDPGTCWEILYSVDGGDLDWLYSECGILPFVVELNGSSAGFQPDWSMRDPTMDKTRDAWKYLFTRCYGPGIMGHVLDACSGAPLSATVHNTDVVFEDGEAPRTTKPDTGRFHWITFPGAHEFSFHADGYYDITIPIDIGSEMLHRDIYLTRLGSYGIAYASQMIHDDTGDGDHVADPGETAGLEIAALATGGALTGVTADLVSADPYVTILNGHATIDDIPAGGIGQTVGPHFEVAYASDAPEGHMALFEITFSANEPLCRNTDLFHVEISRYIYTCPIEEELFDADPGWQIDNSDADGWAFGGPSGGGSPNPGPAAGHSGSYVYGTNLTGNYGSSATYYLTSSAFDCTLVDNVELRFFRWLNTESGYDPASVAVSTDGANWNPLWSGYANDSEWIEMTFNVGDFADGQPEVYFRWGLTSDGGITDSGFYIDDFALCGETASMPNVRMTGVEFDDTVGSCFDGDGRIDAGEEVDITLDLLNRGSQACENTVITLTCDNPKINIIDGTVDVGRIDPETGTAQVVFRIYATGAVECAETALFTATLDATDYSVIMDFSVDMELDRVVTETNMFLDGETFPDEWNFNDWIRSSAYNHSPGGSHCFTANYVSSACWSMKSPEFRVSSEHTTSLSFFTRFNIEENWDGGIVQISFDHGSSWSQLDLTPAYPGTMGNTTSACVGNNVPAFTGESAVWTEYSADLSEYAGQPVVIQFLFGTDASVAYEGWFVDDISITNAIIEHIDCDTTPCGEADTPTPYPTPTTEPQTQTPTETPIATGTPTPTIPFVTPTNTPVPTPTPNPHNGDVDGDGSVTPGDAYFALLIYIGEDPPGADHVAADFCPMPDGDGAVDPGDAYGIARKYLDYAEPCDW